MDVTQFRELLEVAKEFKLDSFKLQTAGLGEVEVHFSEASFFIPVAQENIPVSAMDADEQMLAHIEKLKKQAFAGTSVM